MFGSVGNGVLLMKVSKPAIRYHGSKFRLANWILNYFPQHKIYVEPFGGAAGILLQKKRSYSEVYNDLDGDIVNFFKVIRDKDSRKKLIEAIQLTPFARAEFEEAWSKTDDAIERARRTCIRANMGFGSGGATIGSTGFRIDCNRDYGTAIHLWEEYPIAVESAGRRFQGVLIENRPADQVIENHDSIDTLFFLDPPYLLETRNAKSGGVYRYEMSNHDHLDFLARARKIKGMAIICGYEHHSYHENLPGWEFQTTPSRISSGRGTAIKNECIWINKNCWENLNYDLFSKIR